MLDGPLPYFPSLPLLYNKDAADPRDEDVAFFYAEEANHDAEEAIFEELYGTSTTTVPPPGW